jgi:hypothetical protein
MQKTVVCRITAAVMQTTVERVAEAQRLCHPGRII